MSRERQDELRNLGQRLSRSRWISITERDAIYAAAEAEWDDAMHFAAPWDLRVSLCGKWDRNLIPIDQLGDVQGARCWSCLQVRDWLRSNHPPPQVGTTE